MRITVLVLTMAALVVSAGSHTAAQGSRLQWGGDSLQWNGPVTLGKTLQVRGIRGSMRAVASEDDWIHLEARRHSAEDIPIEVSEHEGGVTICVGGCQSGGRDDRPRNIDSRVDLVVRVPTGVRFSGGMVSGDIVAEGLRSEISAATVSGDVTLQTSGFAATATTVSGSVVLEMRAGESARLHATTVSGAIDSDFPIQLDSASAPPSGDPFGVARTSMRGPRGTVRATIGNGSGPELRVTTVSGSIQLKRR